MLSEMLARSGKTLLKGVAPDGKAYWAARFWDRDAAESHLRLRSHFLEQKETIGRYITKFGDTPEILEFCCGTGEFTRLAAEKSEAGRITALDISEQGLEHTRRRVQHKDLRLVHGSFWDDHGLKKTPVVMCIDAVHHLGDVREVLGRMKEFVAPGGVFIGNLWTADNFHEFERVRYGTRAHLVRTVGFFTTALLIRLSGGRLKTGSYRTQLLTNKELEKILREVFSEVVDIDQQRYFTGFVCRP